MNSKIDSFQKKKEEKERLEFDTQKAYNDRMLSEQERNNGAQRQLGFQQLELQKKQYQDASDNEYYRRKHVYDVQAGNMNPDTYAALYGGSATGTDDLRGKKGGKGGSSNADGQVDYAQLLSDGYKNRPESDLRSFGEFSTDEMSKLQALFPQQESSGQAGQIYKDRKMMKDSLFNQDISMTRDAAGKMRFGMGQENADAKGWDNVKGNVQKNRLNNPRIAPNSNMQGFTPPATQTLGQVSNDIYQGARRSMMSPVAMSPAMQPARQRDSINTTSPESIGYNPFNAYNVTTNVAKQSPKYQQDYRAFNMVGNNSVESTQNNPVPQMPDGYENLRKALRKPKSKKNYSIAERDKIIQNKRRWNQL